MTNDTLMLHNMTTKMCSYKVNIDAFTVDEDFQTRKQVKECFMIALLVLYD